MQYDVNPSEPFWMTLTIHERGLYSIKDPISILISIHFCFFCHNMKKNTQICSIFFFYFLSIHSFFSCILLFIHNTLLLFVSSYFFFSVAYVFSILHVCPQLQDCPLTLCPWQLIAFSVSPFLCPCLYSFHPPTFPVNLFTFFFLCLFGKHLQRVFLAKLSNPNSCLSLWETQFTQCSVTSTDGGTDGLSVVQFWFYTFKATKRGFIFINLLVSESILSRLFRSVHHWSSLLFTSQVSRLSYQIYLPFFIKADIYSDALQYFWLPFMGFGTFSQCWCICLRMCLQSFKSMA